MTDLSSSMQYRAVRGVAMALLGAAAFLTGCASSNRAPVEERKPPTVRTPGTTPTAPSTAPVTTPLPVVTPTDPAKPPPPGIENAGKPGYYSVKPGDTLIRVALDNGQNWRDVARWNAIDNPNLIEVGQVLRVVPPGPDATGVQVKPVAPAGRVDTRPLDGSKPATPVTGTATTTTPAASSAASAAPPPPVPASAPAAPAREPGEEDLNWMWPAAGAVATPFDESKSKGLGITGKAGDPVLAAADGRVVYAGAGLRGYGNLVIVKHNATYLTAYAHNQTLLVKEDQVVRRGQKIAEMGATDADSVKLHFEIRRQGKPIDPARLLPPR